MLLSDHILITSGQLLENGGGATTVKTFSAVITPLITTGQLCGGAAGVTTAEKLLFCVPA